jgi:hydroxyacylglutathione hydrolase
MRYAMQITDHIHALKIPFQIPVAPGKTFERFVNSYPILGPETCLIDCRVKNSKNIIFDYIKKNRQEAGRKFSVGSHPCHLDHMDSAGEIM